MRHLPNIITVLRIASMPFIAWLALQGEFRTSLAIFAVSASTDSLDGWLARKYGWQSRFGAIADPIADKLFLVFIYLSLGWLGAMPRWLVAVVLGRDVLILAFGAAALAFTKVRDFPPTRWGKLSTFFQILAAGATLTRYADLLVVPLWPFFSLTAAWTIGSGLHYLIVAIVRLRDPSPTVNR